MSSFLKNRPTNINNSNKNKQTIDNINKAWFRSSNMSTSAVVKKDVVRTSSFLNKSVTNKSIAFLLWGTAALLSAAPFIGYHLLSRASVSANPVHYNPLSSYSFNEPLLHTAQVELQRGEILANAIRREVPNISGVQSVVNELGQIYDLRKLQVGQKLYINYSYSDDLPILESLTFNSPKSYQTTQIYKNPQGDFTLKQYTEHVSMEQKVVTGRVKSSLYLAGLEAGVPANKLMEMFDLFAYNVDFQRDIHEGNQFDLIFEQYVDSEGALVSSGNIIAAKLKLNNKEVESFRFEYADGKIDYFDRNGSSLKKPLLLMPVQGGRLTSGYSARRNPVYGYSEFHPALDFAAPMGTPIMSAGDGKIIHRGWDPKGYGNYVKVEHANGLMTLYAHMSAFASNAPVGAKVLQGQTIGYIGSTGMSTGPHVHYEVWVSGKRQNPNSVVNRMSSGVTLSGDKLKEFKEFASDVERHFT